MGINIKKYTILISAVIALIVMIAWLRFDPTNDFKTSVPGLDEVPEETNASKQKVNIGAEFEKFNELSNITLDGTWSRFRGADYDNIVKDGISLISSFGNSGPEILWDVDLGEGHAAPVIQKGKVYLLDYMEEEKKDALRCFSLVEGKELWRRSYPVHIKRNHGMSRTIPAVTEDYLLSVGPLGHVMCLDPESGDLLWSLDMVKEYRSEIPFWYTGQCPLIDDGVAVLAPGGKAILIGVDCASGKVLWETPNPDSLQMSHSSIMPVTLGELKTYVYSAIGAVVGVAAEGKNTGDVLWETRQFVPSVIAPSPLYLGDGIHFITAGYGAGSILIKVDPKTFKVEVLKKYKPKEGLASEQQTPVLIGSKVYGILPKDAGTLRNQFVCYSKNDLNTPLWSSGKTNRYGLGPYIFADNKFYIVADDGTLSIASVQGNAFKVLDSYRVIEGHDAWGPIAIADGKLLMRDSKKMLCINIKK